MAAAFTMTGQMTAEEGCEWRGCIGKEEAGTNQIKREVREAWVTCPIQGSQQKENVRNYNLHQESW